MTPRPLVAVVIGLCAAVVVLVLISAAVHRDEPATGDVCAVAARLDADVDDALALAASDDATAADLRDRVDEIQVDLTALATASAGRYSTQISQLEARARDLRQSLTDLDEDTPSAEARPLVEEAADDARPTFQQLMDAIEPLCVDRS